MALAHIKSSTRRTMPADFPEMFVLLGHKTIEEYYGTNWRAVKRWMSLYGLVELIQLRRGYVRKLAASKGFPNAAGRHTRFGDYLEMRSNDPALAYFPVRRCHRPYREEVWVPFRDGREKPWPDG